MNLSLQGIHCGCIVSSHAFVLLDPGGIECFACARKHIVLVGFSIKTFVPPPPLFLVKWTQEAFVSFSIENKEKILLVWNGNVSLTANVKRTSSCLQNLNTLRQEFFFLSGNNKWNKKIIRINYNERCICHWFSLLLSFRSCCFNLVIAGHVCFILLRLFLGILIVLDFSFFFPSPLPFFPHLLWSPL